MGPKEEVTAEEVNELIASDETQASPEEINEAMMKQRFEQYEKMVTDLISKGFSRRNAKRYIAKRSRQIMEKYQKQIKKNAAIPKIYVDPASVTDEEGSE